MIESSVSVEKWLPQRHMRQGGYVHTMYYISIHIRKWEHVMLYVCCMYVCMYVCVYVCVYVLRIMYVLCMYVVCMCVCIMCRLTAYQPQVWQLPKPSLAAAELCLGNQTRVRRLPSCQPRVFGFGQTRAACYILYI